MYVSKLSTKLASLVSESCNSEFEERCEVLGNVCIFDVGIRKDSYCFLYSLNLVAAFGTCLCGHLEIGYYNYRGGLLTWVQIIHYG